MAESTETKKASPTTKEKKTSKVAKTKESPKKGPAKASSAQKEPKKASAAKKGTKEVTLQKTSRSIGLSLGADICWPLCYEAILKRLDSKVIWNGEEVRLDVDRVTLEPFDLAQDCTYDVVLDRLTHWYLATREWIKKSVLMDDLYVFNNPWSIQSMEKHTTYAAMLRLGMPVPRTYMVPPKSYDEHPDLRRTLKSYAKLFDLRAIGEEMGYPMFMKPYDGGGWRGVSMIRNEQELRQRYEESGKQLMHLQEAIDPFDSFVRCIGIGPQTHMVKYDPDAPLHNRYTLERDFVSEEEASLLRDTTLTINAFFGFDFNSCEALRSNGVWHPIDFANACPDSQITSLHYHFPWLVIANLKWSIFCAVTRRKMRMNPDWRPFYEIADKDLPYREKLRQYAAHAEEIFEVEKFEEFCATALKDLDEIAWDFFGSQEAKAAFREKVAALYPAHEVDPFTDLFFQRVQAWREDHKTEVK